ncbi:site-specific recombinase XerD [Brevibacillus aydinogluensis]|uniref:tyrosine-type recombinase/integrase n=1 Tax=Brevibacillus aydinogluensis TaxID=927786 RepID=UPI002892AB61|nr:tyrosine-type recombinase/integrase [Brevibacillus aydinogluensis]MDT3417204.1 site-specific recombinase XerD [Brevibacillus aydinogluensis]
MSGLIPQNDNRYLDLSQQWNQLIHLIERDGWMQNPELAEKLLRDGKVLSLENLDDDISFLAFYLFGKSRNKPLAKSTIEEYQRDMRLILAFLSDPARHLHDVGLTDLPAPPPCRLKDVGRLQLRSFEKYIRSRYAPNTAVRKLSILKGILRFGYEKGYFSHNLRDEFSIGQKVLTITERKLNYEELQAVLNELRKKPLHRIIGQLFILKGLRVSELCAINIGDQEVGLYGDTLVKIKRKGGKVARKKIPKAVMYDIMTYRQALSSELRKKGLELNESPDAPLIPNSGGRRLRRDRVWDIIKRAARRAAKYTPSLQRKYKDVSPHWFRHTFATIALDSGASLQDVKEELGHEDIRTTQIYLHSLKEETGSTLADLISSRVTI